MTTLETLAVAFLVLVGFAATCLLVVRLAAQSLDRHREEFAARRELLRAQRADLGRYEGDPRVIRERVRSTARLGGARR